MASHDLAHALRRSRSEARVFGEVYNALAAGLLRHFTRRTFDVETAADLTAETFARAFESRGRFRGSTDAEASAWITGSRATCSLVTHATARSRSARSAGSVSTCRRSRTTITSASSRARASDHLAPADRGRHAGGPRARRGGAGDPGRGRGSQLQVQ